MTTHQLQGLIHATPFQPFVVHLADGRQLPVRHPDFIAHPPGFRTAVVYQPDESMEIVDLLLVTGLEVRNGATAQIGEEGRGGHDGG